MMGSRLNYYRRIIAAYLTSGKSQLTFWHENPECNTNFVPGEIGEYYMPFLAKADYPGDYDNDGIPLLNYHGKIGLQYNPIAIAQYGLGNYNLFLRTRESRRRENFLRVANWLLSALRKNSAGISVWMHDFDWEYRDVLRAPWYSGLAQGQGISVLLRAHVVTGDTKYVRAAEKAFSAFHLEVADGGVLHVDANGDKWFEEYIVFPPTHILNGFIWASWGVYDYWLATRERDAKELFESAVGTLKKNLGRFDTGFWSLYEQSGTALKMLASPFYHRLHIAQLKAMYRLTREQTFAEYSDRWESYMNSGWRRHRAFAQKAVFKLLYY